MKVLVFSHHLVMGGTAVNAIELAATLRDLHGWEVVLFASPGRLVSMAEEKKLRYVAAPDIRFHPTPGILRSLRDLVRRERPDVLHAWDWWQCVDAYYAVHLPMGLPMMVSDMTMGVTRLLPRDLLTTFGTPEIVEMARAQGRKRAALLLPPVDVERNAPGAVDPGPFRDAHGLRRDEITLVVVSRLARFLKSESLRRTIEAVAALGRELPLRLVVVGEGELREELEKRAADINRDLRRTAISFTGLLLDPRPAYAAADIVIGMGGSALRGMAFGKPLLVVGEQGFADPFDQDTAAAFHHRGMYGRGDGDPANARLVNGIRRLAGDRSKLGDLGDFARRHVLAHYSLEAVSTQLVGYYRDAMIESRPFGATALDAIRTAAVYLRERRFLVPCRDRFPD